MEKTSVELLGVEKGNGTTLTRKHNLSDIDTSPVSISTTTILYSLKMLISVFRRILLNEIFCCVQPHIYND